MNASPFSRAGIFLPAIAAAIVADQAIKLLVESRLPFHEAVPVLPFFALYRTYNDGIAFSLLSGLHGLGLAALALGVVGFVLYLWFKTPPQRHFAHPGYALIIGGALGNLIDRTVHGYVIDYILLYTQTWSFAVFNLADAFISVGAALVVIDELVDWMAQHRAAKSDESSDT